MSSGRGFREKRMAKSIAELQAEIKELTAKLEAQAEENIKLQEKNSEITDQVNEQGFQITNLTKEKENLVEKNKALIKDNSELTDQLKAAVETKAADKPAEKKPEKKKILTADQLPAYQKEKEKK